jgi:hypothetical protein
MIPNRCFAIGAAAALALIAAGCAPGAVPPPPEVVTASVPIAAPVYCDVPQLSRPALPIAALTSASQPADTVRAYAASVALLKSAVVERDAILAGCAAPAAPSPSATPVTSGTN